MTLQEVRYSSFIKMLREELKKLTDITYCDRSIARFISETLFDFTHYLSNSYSTVVVYQPIDLKLLQEQRKNFEYLDNKEMWCKKLLSTSYSIDMHNKIFKASVGRKRILLFLRKLLREKRTDISLIDSYLKMNNVPIEHTLRKRGRAELLMKKSKRALLVFDSFFTINDSYTLRFFKKEVIVKKEVKINCYIIKLFHNDIDITHTLKIDKALRRIYTVDYFENRSIAYETNNLFLRSTFQKDFCQILNNLNLKLPSFKPTLPDYQYSINEDIHIFATEVDDKTIYRVFYKSLDITFAVRFLYKLAKMTIQRRGFDAVIISNSKDKKFCLERLKLKIINENPQLLQIKI